MTSSIPSYPNRYDRDRQTNSGSYAKVGDTVRLNASGLSGLTAPSGAIYPIFAATDPNQQTILDTASTNQQRLARILSFSGGVRVVAVSGTDVTVRADNAVPVNGVGSYTITVPRSAIEAIITSSAF